MKMLKKILSFGAVSLALWGLWLPGAAGLLVVGGCGGGGDEAVVANAGADADVLVGVSVALDGSASTGVDSAAWTITSAPDGSTAALTDETTLTPGITPDVAGDYVVELSVNDGAATDPVTITAAAAISSIAIPEGSAITTRERFGVTEYVVDAEATGATLSGAGSEAAALVMKNAAVTSYLWEQVSGPEATIVDDATETLDFTAPALSKLLNQSDVIKWQVLPISRNDTKMVFKLTVTGADGATAAATIDIYLQDAGTEIHPASGLWNVGVGGKVYLGGPTYKTIATAAITDWSWTLTVPAGSSATFADSGTTASTVQIPNFVPDVAGIYTIAYDSASGNSTKGVVNLVKTPGTILINAGEYVGIGTIGGTTALNPQCATCHGSSDLAGLGDKVTEWEGTLHSHIFEDNMATYVGLAPEPYLWQFHTVGYNNDATSGGFDDLAAEAGFTFPADGLTFADFTANDPDVAVLANVQCESCHGPGSEHSGDPLRIGVSASNAGVCGQCHVEEDEWKHSAKNSISTYASFTGTSGGWNNYTATGFANDAVCTRCHVTQGFLNYLEGGQDGEVVLTDAQGAFGGVTCVACHDPHDATNSYHLRAEGEVTLAVTGETVNAGKGAVCYGCHMGSYKLNEPDCDSDLDGDYDSDCTTWDMMATKSHSGAYHDATQGTILEGVQCLDITDGTAFPSTENSAHSGDSFTLAGMTGDTSLSSTPDKCVNCHMAPGPEKDEEGYQQIGGHTFKTFTEDGLENISACTRCHSESTINETTGFNRLARADYDGDGAIEGIQDEVKGLLVAITTKMKAADTEHINQNTDVVIGTAGACTTSATITTATCYGPSGGSSTSGSFIRTIDNAAYGEVAGEIHVGTILINGTVTGLTEATKCSTKTDYGTGPGEWFANTTTGTWQHQGYRACNFAQLTDAMKRAYWNVNSIVNDESKGIHNAAYVIQVLQGTYTDLGTVGEYGTFASEYPLATIR